LWVYLQWSLQSSQLLESNEAGTAVQIIARLGLENRNYQYNSIYAFEKRMNCTAVHAPHYWSTE
jgi:hypothetical protein